MRLFAALLMLSLTLACRAVSAPTAGDAPDLFSPVEPPATHLLVDPETPVKGGVSVVYFDDDVNDANVKDAIDDIQAANDAHVSAIVLELDTYGGSVDAGRKLVKIIESSKAPVHCVVNGNAMSMGFYILQSCATRTMTDDSVLMAHGITETMPFSGKGFQWQSRANMLTAEDTAFCKHEARHMKLTAEQLCEKIHYTEWFMTSDEASKVGAVDTVAPNLQTVTDALKAGKSWPRPVIEKLP